MEFIRVIPTFFSWWYSGGIKKLFDFLEAVFVFLNNIFSPLILLKTLFSPWKNLVGVPRPGISGLKDWLIDNFISRGVGFFVRIFVFLVFLVFLIFYLIFSFLVILFWFGFPLILAFCFWNIFR